MGHTIGSHSDDRGRDSDAPCYCLLESKLREETVIRVHFTGRDTLQLHGAHVPTFFQNYQKAIEIGDSHFISEGQDKIMIQMDKVTFVEETTIKVEDVPF